MLNNRNKLSCLAIAVSFFSTASLAASIDKAAALQHHGLVDESKLELIEVLYGKSSKNDKAEAQYQLGNIAFKENNISVALSSWKDLIASYPKSKQAILVQDRIKQLSEIVGESSKETLDNAIASSYLRHADFWSKNKSNTFTIDSSWIPKIEASLKWYDKTIFEFPNSKASKLAYQDKMRTLLGWKDSGRYGSSYGIKESFDKYMPILLETFSSF
jgi:hypothetical protein